MLYGTEGKAILSSVFTHNSASWWEQCNAALGLQFMGFVDNKNNLKYFEMLKAHCASKDTLSEALATH